jgi:diguanylate cyclase (GGDEF)-like protein
MPNTPNHENSDTPEPVDPNQEALFDISEAAGRAQNVLGELSLPKPDPTVEFSDKGGPLAPGEKDLMQDTHNQYVAELERAVQYDQLTGLRNKQGFLHSAQELALQTQRTGKPLAVLSLDLGSFKFINDTYGHDAGDELLKKVAERLRRDDLGGVLGRPSGDEFLIIAPIEQREGSEELLPEEIVERMKQRYVQVGLEIAAEDPRLQTPGKEFRIDAGGAVYTGENRIEDALRVSDLDMYKSKRARQEAEGTILRGQEES